MDLFTSGSKDLIPKADAARQAVASLRGYAYQVTAASLAWLDVEANSRMYLEVAEDYAIVAEGAFKAVQVKDTSASRVTLNTQAVRDAILHFVELTEDNSAADVFLEYFTTSEIGTEKPSQGGSVGEPGLDFWRSAAKGADVAQLRSFLESDKFPQRVRDFVNRRDDEAIRKELLRKIRWNCGRPDIAALNKEFVSRLTVVGWDRFGVPPQDIATLADALLYRVLMASIVPTPGERVLTRSDLIREIAGSTQVTLPRTTINALASLSGSLVGQMIGGAGGMFPVASGSAAWLADSGSLPKPRRFMSRTTVEGGVEAMLRTHGACFLTGASGVGKTSVARSVAGKLGDRFYIVEFRDLDANETRIRLDALLSRLGGMSTEVLLMEDLNVFNDPQVALVAAQIFEALGRRDIAVVVTCYVAPSPKSLANCGLESGCTMQCPYFAVEEAVELVALHGGDQDVWGRLAFVSGAFGHPQLVHAFIAGMAARGWPKSEIPKVLKAGISSDDVAAEQDTARRNIAAALPDGAKNLLFRLSLVIGSFSRALALKLGSVPPPIDQPGECLDVLIGPWVETVGSGTYRVSPLAAKFGKEMILPDVQTGIHHTIATQLVSMGTVDVGDLDKVFMHAIVGKNNRVLFGIVNNLVTSDGDVIKHLGQNFSILRVLGEDEPIYKDDPILSTLLRLLQYKVVVAAKDVDRIEKCARALMEEAAMQRPVALREPLQFLALATILAEFGIATHLDNWVDLLRQYHALALQNTMLQDVRVDIEGGSITLDQSVSLLFAIGSAELPSVAKLEGVIDQLDMVRADLRGLLLGQIREISPDFAVLINNPWVTEQRGTLDFQDAAERYLRMARKTGAWGIRSIALQCWIARAIMFDEHANDRVGALAVLEEAVAAFGEDVLLTRARAKIFWRAGDHEQALLILRAIADVVGRDNDIERAFALREAAISAAKTGDWRQAEEWFFESRTAALEAPVPDMRVMALGLQADAAVAAFQQGHIGLALNGLATALTELRDLDPTSSLRATYCHHVVRHNVAWLLSRINGFKPPPGQEALTMEPGSCSNPDPPEAIRERPLGALDVAWYLLAEAEIASRVEVGIEATLDQRLTEGRVPILDVLLRERRLWQSIEYSDVEAFAAELWSFVEGRLHYSRNPVARSSFDVVNPPRGTIFRSSPDDDWEVAKPLVDDAVIAFAIVCACFQRPKRVSMLRTFLTRRFGKERVDSTVLARVGSAAPCRPATFAEELIDHVMACELHARPNPKRYCIMGIRFLQQAWVSPLQNGLYPLIAAWQRDAWTTIIRTQAFQLVRPVRTLPRIEAALVDPQNDERFLCRLILATAEATDVVLHVEIRAELESRATAVSP